MTAGTLLDRALERYGQTVTVEAGGGAKTVRAVVQPMTENRETLPEVITSLGGSGWAFMAVSGPGGRGDRRPCDLGGT